ncbi:hypothetical protein Hanom_Chr12g01146241 [Helianthus anomalus]
MILSKSHIIRFRKSHGVAIWYQSFDCSELGFFLESRLQSLGLSHENIFTKYFSLHLQNAKIHGTNILQRKDKNHEQGHSWWFSLQGVPLSSSESGLSDAHNPMAIVSDDEILSEPEIFTSDTESDREMLSDDDDDFQPFALPDFGDDAPLADGIPVEDLFDFPAPIHDHLIIGHPDGEHIVAPILDPVPLVGDGEVDDVIVLGVPPPVIVVIELSSNTSPDSVSDSFESVTSSALRAAELQLHATDSDDDTAMSVAPLSIARVHTPPLVLEPVPEPDPVPFGLPDIAPLILEPTPAPFDLPLVDPYVPQPPPLSVVSPPPVMSDAHRTDLPIVFR